MRKIRKRILAVALAAVMLVHIPGTASYAEQAAGDVETTLEMAASAEIAASVEVTASAETEPEEDGSEDIPETAADTGNGLEPDAEKPEKEETAPSEGEGKDCDCVTLCTGDSVNGDCPVCGAEGADLSACRGEEQNNVPDSGKEDGTDTAQCICGIACTEDSINGDCPVCGAEGADLSVCEGKEKEEETTEVTEPEEAETEDTNLCAHHKEHTEDCGFVPATEDSEGSPCTYECRICPIEDLIAALPDEVTADNAENVRARLDEILALYGELDEAEQEQIDLSRCMELQEALDAANAPVPAAETVSYREMFWNESSKTLSYTDKTADSCTPVVDSEVAVTWDAEWYVVNSTVTIAEPITVEGNVSLILADGCTLTADKGIVVTANNSLTIYAQAGGTGTLRATGVVDENDYSASAGIGGSATDVNSGAVTIHGGNIHATGGGNRFYYGAAGIGGGVPVFENGQNGGDSGAVTIFGGTVTADSGVGGVTGAGIGGGAGIVTTGQCEGGDGNNITIYGGTVTATSHGGGGGAGIGGGGNGGDAKGGDGSHITICGGTVTATGSTKGAGIGGGAGSGVNKASGSGSNITISGGVVTAVGGKYAAGIGGGGGYDDQPGGAGTNIEITGGIVDAYSPPKVPWEGYEGAPIGNGGNASGGDAATKEDCIIFENGVGLVYGTVVFAGRYDVPVNYKLTIPSGASLSGTGLLTGSGTFVTENITADMISVPEGWHYTSDDMAAEIENEVSLKEAVEICGKTFQVDTKGWTWSVTKVTDLEYTVKYTYTTNGREVKKTVTLEKATTTLSGVAAYKADGTTQATTFSVDEKIVVKATPKIVANGAMLAADFAAPTAKQMALYVGGTQVSAPADAGPDGSYTMTVSAADVLTLGRVGPGKVALTAKFVGNDSQSGTEEKVEVTITAVAKVENGTTIYVGELAEAFNSVNTGATVTLLTNVTQTQTLYIQSGTFTLDLNGHTISGNNILAQGNLTIRDDSETGGGAVEEVYAESEMTIYGGTYNIITIPKSNTFKNILAEDHAYYGTDGKPIALDELKIGNGWGDDLKLSGPVTVKECKHEASVCAYAHIPDTATHSMTCRACGKVWDAENCRYTFTGNVGTCQDCKSKLTVTVTGTDGLTYDGAAKSLSISVTVDGQILDANNYTVSYSDNINAGENTVIVKENNNAWNFEQNFTIAPAKPTVKWDNASQKLTYTGQPAGITAPVVTLVNNESFNGTITYFNPEDGTVYHTLPAAVGTYKVKARIDAAGNYAAAESADTLTLTISYMAPPANILYNNGTKQNYYGRKEVVISTQGYKVSESQDSGYADSFTIPVPGQTGTVKKTLYFSKDGGISDGVEITVDFDLTPPAGSITVGKGFWDSFLEKVSFGHYKAKEYVVAIKAEDAGGSGIGKTEYVIVKGKSQYTDPATLEAAGLSWTEYTGKPTVPTSGQYAVYARLTDKVGNVTYISTDGILLDETPPMVDGLSVPEGTVGTETAEFTFTVDEAADYYYVVLPEGAATPEKEDIMTAGAGGTAVPGSAASGRGEVTEEQITGGKAAVSVKVTGLIPGTAYKVHVTAADKTVDLETGAPAGNVAEVETSSTFTMKKLDQAAPALSYKTDRTDKNNIKITIDPVKGAWYSFDGGQTWADSNEQAGFDSSQTVTLAIQMKETATHNASPAQTVTVNLAKEDRDAPPAFTLKYDANGETDYTVTIPPTEGCEYSFDGENWSDSNVKTGVKVGETVTGYKRYKETDQYNTSNAASASETMPKFTVKTPVVSPAGGSFAGSVSVTITCGTPGAEIYYTTDGSTPGSSSTRYTGAFTVTAPARVRAIAIKEGFQDSAVAEASYTKQSGGGSSGGDGNGSGGNGSGGGNGGNNSGPGTGGDTAPVTPVIPPAADEQTGPGTETEQAGPGNGNTSKPGSGNTGTPGNKTEQGNTPQDGREPFIKGEDGKIGWDVIRTEEEMAEDGDTIHIDMNGSTVVPGDIFDRLKGRDITITFDMGDGILWSVDGKSITTDKAGDIDFGLKTGVRAIPVDIVNNVTGERYSIQISLAYSGEFGFTAVLSIGLGKENAGYTASLYYYNKSTGELEFICKDTVAQDGTVSLSFTHASDYVIAIDTETTGGKEEEDSTSEEPGTDGSGSMADTEVKEEVWNYKWIIVIGAFVIAAGLGILLIYKKKKEEQQ